MPTLLVERNLDICTISTVLNLFQIFYPEVAEHQRLPVNAELSMELVERVGILLWKAEIQQSEY